MGMSLGLMGLGLTLGGGGLVWSQALTFPASNASWDADFVNNQYSGATLQGTMCQQQLVNLNPNFMENADGSLTTFTAQTTVRRTNKGMVLDGQDRANQIIQNRTLTNAAWVTTSCVAAKDQTGRTGVANSACSVTTSGANATILQSVTISGSAFYGYVEAKRISGSGTIEMTIDGGLSWALLDVSTPIFNGWAKATKAVQTPGAGTFNMGFRFSTSGDVWAIDFVEVNPVATEFSPVATTTAKLTGIRDRPSSQISDNSVPALYLRDNVVRCVYAEFAFRTAGGIITASGGTILNVRATDCQAFSAAVTTPNAPTLATSFRLTQLNKVMCWQSATQTGIILNGGTEATASGGAPDGALTHWDWLTNGTGSAQNAGRLTRMFGLSAIPPAAIRQAWTT